MRLRGRLERLRTAALTLVQGALAAGLAWLVSVEVVGHAQPFFAPVAAIQVLGLTAGLRWRRALEVAGGVTLGIAVGDLLVNLLGAGAWQLVAIVLSSMAVAVLLGASAVTVTQTGVSAVLVVTLEQPQGFVFTRTIDAAVGTSAALFLSFVVLPRDPLRLVQSAAAPVLAELAGTLEDIASALDARDAEATKRALRRARGADPLAQDLAGALVVARETARAALSRRGSIAALDAYSEAGAQLDLAVRNTRVLARGALRALEIGDRVPPAATAALRELATAVRSFDPWLRDLTATEDVRRHAIGAARRATAVLEGTANLSVSVIVGTIRSTAVDLLRGTGVEREEAVRLVRQPPAASAPSGT